MDANLVQLGLIGYFILCIGLRKLPLARLDEMIETKQINGVHMRGIIIYYIFVLLGSFIVVFLTIANSINILNGILSHNLLANVVTIKSAVILILTIIWYFTVMSPLVKKLNMISEKGDK